MQTAEQQAAAHGASRVTRIKLRIGHLAAVVTDALTFSFSIVARDTCAQDATLDIEYVPWRVRCCGCQTDYVVQDELVRCPRCEHVGGDILTGRELQITELDLE